MSAAYEKVLSGLELVRDGLDTLLGNQARHLLSSEQGFAMALDDDAVAAAYVEWSGRGRGFAELRDIETKFEELQKAIERLAG